MVDYTLHQEIDIALKAGFDSFNSGKHGEHTLTCPKCKTVGNSQSKDGFIICGNNECRVGRFFTD